MTDTQTQTPPLAPQDVPAPTALSDGSRRAIRAVVVIAAILLCLGAVGSLTVAAVGIGRTRVVADSAELPAALRSLTIDAGDIPIGLRVTSDPEASSPRAELKFVSSAGGGTQSLDLTSDPDGTKLALRGGAPEWLRWAQAGEVTVVLPPALGQGLTLITTQQVGVLMVDADLDRLVARNDSGAVLLRGSARTVEVHNKHGSVRSRQPISVRESFSANSVDGDISIDFRDAPPRRIEAATGDGDVTIGLPGAGPFAVNASTGSEEANTVVRVPQVVEPAAAVSVVTARSAAGNVTIEDHS